MIAPSMRRRIHGGRSKRGPEAPTFVHGRYAATMPDELRTLFAAARSDPQVLDLTDDAALATAMTAWLLGRWTDGEERASDALARVRMAWEALKTANASGNTLAISVAAQQVDDALRRVAPAKLESIREEIRRQQNIKRRIIETALKADVMSQTLIPVVQAQQVVSTLVDAFLKIVTDPAQQEAIRRAFERVVRAPVSSLALPAGDAGSHDGTEDS